MDYFAVFLNSHRSNKEVSALAGLGWAGLGEVIFHFTHNVPLPPYISQYTPHTLLSIQGYATPMRKLSINETVE